MISFTADPVGDGVARLAARVGNQSDDDLMPDERLAVPGMPSGIGLEMWAASSPVAMSARTPGVDAPGGDHAKKTNGTTPPAAPLGLAMLLGLRLNKTAMQPGRDRLGGGERQSQRCCRAAG